MGNDLELAVGHAATKIAESIDANCIITIEKEQKEEYKEDSPLDVSVTVFKKIKRGLYGKEKYKSKIRKPESGSVTLVKEVIIDGIKKDHIKKNDQVVCVVDESVGTGYKSLLFIFDVDKIFFNISTHDLAANISPDVIESIIKIAQEIAEEGREGKKVGTAFIIGDKGEVLKYTKQLIINPFLGYGDEFKKITDPNIKETVKEFAQLDGAFIIDDNGLIISTGSYINIDTSKIDLPGYGTKHRACAAITKETNAIAVVVSTSGGKITIFKGGKIVMKI